MQDLGATARAAAAVLRLAPAAQKTKALHAAAHAIKRAAPAILDANASDLKEATSLGPAMRDRLLLDEGRLEAMANGIAQIADLPDPVGRELARWTRPNGLSIARISVPIGVIGIIFESRPNVTADAAALCVKSGNAVILRAGSEALKSARAIAACMREGLAEAGLPEGAVTLVPTADREAVGEMLRGLGGAIDLIIPRGGKGLVARVQSDARVPVLAHLEGNCHVYVDGGADLEMARRIVLNAKMRRTGVCGAAETLLVDRACAATHLAPLLQDLLEAGCALRGDEAAMAADPRVTPASEADWAREYLDAIMAVRVVDGVREAIAHIAAYGSSHTDAIVTQDPAVAARFLNEVDSAIVLHNASTQFADGGEFGFGAEIGIATGKLHARGPVGTEQLTTFKYAVHGTGQTRP
ncbi:MAG: glutamate-5-semialdehyde dehydrogenase [Alphaproteobacteria bacterium]|nr:glutamate-5-semialdehyde dehydrogenase [Alphaproteobacteria bacterium]